MARGSTSSARSRLERRAHVRWLAVVLCGGAPSIAAELLLAWDLWILGYPDQACVKVHRILRAAEQADPYTAAFAHYVTSAVHLLRGEYELSLRHADRSFELSANNRISLYALYSRFGRGCALLKLGQHQTGLSEIRTEMRRPNKANSDTCAGSCWAGWLSLKLKTGTPRWG